MEKLNSLSKTKASRDLVVRHSTSAKHLRVPLSSYGGLESRGASLRDLGLFTLGR